MTKKQRCLVQKATQILHKTDELRKSIAADRDALRECFEELESIEDNADTAESDLSDACRSLRNAVDSLSEHL